MTSNNFPLFRLATLLARQLSAPIASRIKQYAVSHPRFGVAVCTRVALAFQWCEWRARAAALRLGGARLPASARPPPLPARVAQDLGSDLLGEIIIFGLGALIVIFEVNRQADKQEAKELDELSQWTAIALSLEELQREVKLQQTEIDELRVALGALRRARDDGSVRDDGAVRDSPPHTSSDVFMLRTIVVYSLFLREHFATTI